ncbi:hypothetical protein D9M73_206460 [compost metagenome]
MLLFDQHPGDGGGISQVDRQLQVRAAEKSMLAGQPAYQAGQFGVEGQVVVPERLVAHFANSIQTVSAPIVKRRTQGRLAGGDTQKQGFGRFTMAAEVDQRRADHELAQLARGDTHNALELVIGRRGGGAWQLVKSRAPPEAVRAA